MTENSYALSLLSRAIAFKNLSSASLHVGLSQPQLSRLIAKLEKEFGMELLDRKVKRKSSWTPQAIQLAELYTLNQRRLEDGIRSLQTNQRARQVHIGTLEGLADVAIGLAEKLFNSNLKLVYLDVYDRSDLEGKFLSGDLDLILTTRFPSPTKPRYAKLLGYQMLTQLESDKDYALFSSFEFNVRGRQKAPAKEKRTLVSNSLYIRRKWMEDLGGSGWLPSQIFDKPRKGSDEVHLLGGDWIDSVIWQTLNA